MPIDQKQGQLASLIISIIILIIVIILIVIVCCNWNTNNTTASPLIKNPQALAAAYAYKNNFNSTTGNLVNQAHM
uniref:Uncharacterized protein n=1 Tax=viral metagenome TaxID=1070528 RepID=A0A6C0I219_9ZZZZ